MSGSVRCVQANILPTNESNGDQLGQQKNAFFLVARDLFESEKLYLKFLTIFVFGPTKGRLSQTCVLVRRKYFLKHCLISGYESRVTIVLVVQGVP